MSSTVECKPRLAENQFLMSPVFLDYASNNADGHWEPMQEDGLFPHVCFGTKTQGCVQVS